MQSAPGQSPSINPDVFFSVLNDVLKHFDREPLSDASPHKAVITVLPDDRVLQILAGPGSGKTETLVWRVLYELFVHNLDPSRILLTTFTKRAATELQVRIVERCDLFLQIAHSKSIPAKDPQIFNLRVGTIHSLCDQMLAEYDPQYMESGTEVIEEAESSIRLASTLWLLGHSSNPARQGSLQRLTSSPELVALFRPYWAAANWPYRKMEVVDYAKGLIAQHTETWIPRCSKPFKPNGVELVTARAGISTDLQNLQKIWEQYLDSKNVLDFTTLQKRFLDHQSAILDKFDHVFVDEFQDSNPIQFTIHTHWLGNAKTRLTVVGDDDQSIYRFRGSDIGCFSNLQPYCSTKAVAYRQETLSTNYRSTKNIVGFSEAFKKSTLLSELSMPKTVTASNAAEAGTSVRLLKGDWKNICDVVAQEINSLGAGRPQFGDQPVPSVAYMAFTTSERVTKYTPLPPALQLRQAIESRKIRAYNPRNKTAGENNSAVAMLLALVSYLIDPISKQPVGKNGRLNEVWASCGEDFKVVASASKPPQFPINPQHASLQKAFVKFDGEIGCPGPTRLEVISYVDTVRTNLTNLKSNEKGRMTLAGFVSRLLSFSLFRNCGFTVQLFRQALFTQLLEANISPTRLSMESLDEALEVRIEGGKYKWHQKYWTLLGLFGGYLQNTNLDDPEVEAFEQDSVLMITFHQAKGLEFDHVYVAGTGRKEDLGPALRTQLFSGQPINYSIVPELTTSHQNTVRLALADREREVYVAITRGRKSLTILYDPSQERAFELNPAIQEIFRSGKRSKHSLNPAVEVIEKTYA